MSTISATPVPEPDPQAPSKHSCAEADKVRITHVELDLDMDFKRRQLGGAATLTLDWKSPDAKELLLDTEELDIAAIHAIADDGAAKKLPYSLAPAEPHLGSPLTITAPGQPGRIRVEYSTAASASGLQWLEPEKTAGKRLPFMFSQSEATHARSWVPLQDTPAIRFRWTARVRAPEGIRVIMSTGNDAGHRPGGEFTFEQPNPVPAYLLALAAGDLAATETGPRSAVYAEPAMLEKAAREFEDTEKMIQAAEKLYGPYPWSRYDILVLPPSFPFGGMENPDMTFATPTVLVGDKSLVSLVAHELAHSWSGNLVTAAAWRDIWLNEGVTTYVQNRITETLFGTRQANEETLLDMQALKKSLEDTSENMQWLAPRPCRMAADDALHDVPYKKGSWLMRTLEQRFGRERFDAWMKGYFAHFAWQSITTEQMLEHLQAHLLDKHPGVMSREEVDRWVYAAGIPGDAPIPDSPAFDAVDARRKRFLDGQLEAAELQAGNWNTQEWMYFLDGLPDVTRLDLIRSLDTAWHLTGTPNAEIGMRWYRRAIAAGNDAVRAAAAEHMQRIGRLYLTLPLYRAFAKNAGGLAFAKDVYAQAGSGYHPLTQRGVERILENADKGSSAKR